MKRIRVQISVTDYQTGATTADEAWYFDGEAETYLLNVIREAPFEKRKGRILDNPETGR